MAIVSDHLTRRAFAEDFGRAEISEVGGHVGVGLGAGAVGWWDVGCGACSFVGEVGEGRRVFCVVGRALAEGGGGRLGGGHGVGCCGVTGVR